MRIEGASTKMNLMLCALGSLIYFEWIESKWADGVARDGMADEWWQINRFEVHTTTFPPQLLQLPLLPMMLLGSFM